MTWKEATIYPEVALKRLLSKSEEWIAPQAEEEYQLLTVRMWGKGIVERGVMKGSEIAAKRMYVVRPQQFIISRIDARHGASGLIPDKFDGAITTNEFPIFNTNSSLLIPQYLEWLSKTPDFIELCKAASEGTTNRVRLKEDKFFNLEIPLPPLEEQQRIVARIEELETAIGEARGLRNQSLGEVGNLLLSVRQEAFSLSTGEKIYRVNDFCDHPQYGYTQSATEEPIGPHFLRITDIQDGNVNWDNVPYCFCPDPQKYLLEPNDLVFARTGATTGKSFVIKDCPKAVFASYLIRLRVRHTVSIDYLYQYFQSPEYWAQIEDEKKGTGQPNLNGKKLSNLKVPVPSFSKQKEIVAYLDDLQAKIDSLKRLQAETAAELDALLPSILDKAFKGEL